MQNIRNSPNCICKTDGCYYMQMLRWSESRTELSPGNSKINHC